MSKYLKGNYPISKEPEAPKPDSKPGETSTEQFERRALERLGGSIAFVKKDAFVWTGDQTPKPKAKKEP